MAGNVPCGVAAGSWLIGAADVVGPAAGLSTAGSEADVPAVWLVTGALQAASSVASTRSAGARLEVGIGAKDA
jgi:hypothetical protein